MRICWKLPGLALLAAVALLAGGCGGINASKNISPLDFLMPGLIKADPPRTNAPAILVNHPVEVAFVR